MKENMETKEALVFFNLNADKKKRHLPTNPAFYLTLKNWWVLWLGCESDTNHKVGFDGNAFDKSYIF